MQLSAVILLALCLQVTASGISQTVTFKGKNVSLEEIFNEVKIQTGMVFVYTAVELQKSKPVSITAYEVPVGDFLEEVLALQPLQFKIVGTTVFIRNRIDAIAKSAPQPELNEVDPPVSGIVRDAEGNPLPGVNIIVKETQKGTITDAAGRFSINAKRAISSFFQMWVLKRRR